tara:strand:- start:187 stop:573 length:387 start_codon:yes stop_codon:yes gene_type:complete
LSKEAKVVLSLDYGTENIGTCIAETYTGQTKPLPVIKNNDSFYAVLDNLLSEWSPNIVLIGIPPRMSSAFNEGLNEAKAYIANEHKIKVIEVNEDFTTQGLDKDKKNHMKDSHSAELIFQDWFNDIDG